MYAKLSIYAYFIIFKTWKFLILCNFISDEKWKVVRTYFSPQLTTGKIKTMSYQMLDTIHDWMDKLIKKADGQRCIVNPKMYRNQIYDISSCIKSYFFVQRFHLIDARCHSALRFRDKDQRFRWYKRPFLPLREEINAWWWRTQLDV